MFIFSLAAAVSAESHISHSGWKVTASSVNANEKWAPEKMIDDDVTTLLAFGIYRRGSKGYAAIYHYLHASFKNGDFGL